MNKIISSLVISVALASFLNAATYATVNGEDITNEDIAMALQNPNVEFDKLPQETKTQILEQLINMKLISQKAIKDGIEKDPQFKNSMEKIKSNLALEVWQKNQVDSLKITEKDKKDFYEKNKDKFVEPETFLANHILLENEEQAKKVIAELNKATKKLEKFKQLAKKSLDKSSAEKGGELPVFAADQMVPEFSAEVKSLKKDTYSKKPIKTQFGYHVIYLRDKFPPKTFKYEEVEKNINQALIGEKLNEKIKTLIESLKKDAKIVIK